MRYIFGRTPSYIPVAEINGKYYNMKQERGKYYYWHSMKWCPCSKSQIKNILEIHKHMIFR